MISIWNRGSAALIAGLVLVAAGHAAQAAEMTLYERANFGGAQLTLRGWTPSIGNTGFNDRTSSIVVVSGRWEVCTDNDFKGTCTTLGPGEYPALQGMNDRISSAREVGTNGDRRGSYLDYGRGSIELYVGPGFAGRSLQLDADAPSLDRSNFNDRAASVVVMNGTWELCTDANFRGDCRIYGPGRYPDLGYGMAKELSSARLVRGAATAPAVISQGVPDVVTTGARAVLYEERGLNGRSLALSGPVADLDRSSFNDAALSLYVESGTWILCRDAYFRGGCRSFEPGRYDELAVYGMDHVVSSVRPGGPAERAREVPRGIGMELYSETDFRGEKLGFESDGMDLAQNNFSRRAQSMIVYVGDWEVCTEVGIRGSCAVYRPGNYPRLGGLSGKIVSLRRNK